MSIRTIATLSILLCLTVVAAAEQRGKQAIGLEPLLFDATEEKPANEASSPTLTAKQFIAEGEQQPDLQIETLTSRRDALLKAIGRALDQAKSTPSVPQNSSNPLRLEPPVVETGRSPIIEPL